MARLVWRLVACAFLAHIATFLAINEVEDAVNHSVDDEQAAMIRKYLQEVKDIEEADSEATEVMMTHNKTFKADFNKNLLDKEEKKIDQAHKGAGDELTGEPDIKQQNSDHDREMQEVIEELKVRKRNNTLPSEMGVLLNQLTYHDSHYQDRPTKRRRKRKASTHHLWTRGVVPYIFDPDLLFKNQSKVEAQVKVAMSLWEKDTCLKFVHWTPEISEKMGHNSYLKFQPSKSCSAVVGRHSAGQYIGLGKNGCGVSGAAHEIGHSLGLHHEQVRDDRDNYVIYQCWNKADPGDSNVASKKQWPSAINLAKYDFMSLMHYGAYSNVKSVLAVRNPDLMWIGSLGQLPDFYDKLTISEAYQCFGTCDKTLCKNDGYMIQDSVGQCQCKCVEGLGGDTCATTDTEAGYTCGEMIDLKDTGEYVTINSPQYPYPYESGRKCAWLLTAPKGMVVKIEMQKFDLPEDKTKYRSKCTHWLEVRNNIIGQLGRKYCGDQWLLGAIDSRMDFNNNQMLLLLDASNKSVSNGHGFQLKARAYSDGCLSDPCQGAPCKATGVNGGYKCDFRARSFHCDFNQGCLCYFTLHEDVYPQDHKNWKITRADSADGSYALMAKTSRFDPKRDDTAVLRTIPIGFDACVTFTYKSTGGRFRVRVYENGKPSCRLLDSAGKTNGWIVKTLKVVRDPNIYSSNDVLQVGFIASNGNERGNVFLDDITVNRPGSSGECVVDACFKDPCHGYPCADIDDVPRCSYPVNTLWTCDFEVASPCHGFENFNSEGLYNWIVTKGPTPTPGTGPTTGADRGRYLYMEASNKKKGAMFIMRLVIPFAGDRCLRFKYNMYGRGIGTLNIYHVKNGVKGAPVWSQSGNKETRNWLNGEVDTKEAGQIWFEGIVGNSNRGDIAIDMIAYHPVACTNLPPVAEVTALPRMDSYTCSFKDKNICNRIEQSTDDDFNWSIRSGSTPTPSTGPSIGPNGQADRYAYIEATRKRAYSKAVLEFSPQLADGNFCLTFQYHMYGRQMGILNIYHRNNGISSLIWTLTGEQGNDWKQGSVDINFVKHSKIIIEGVRGSHSHSDMAIDDIKMSADSCPHGRQPADAYSDPNVLKCGFEVGAYCRGMYVDEGAPITLRTRHGSTPSRRTGPSSAAKQNFYLYLETSYGSARDYGLFVVGNEPVSQGPRCLTFQYSMHGTTIGHLNIYHSTEASENKIWSLSLDQGKDWHKAAVDIQMWACHETGCDMLLIKAIKGASSTGDIAIDDVVFAPGLCPGGTVPLEAVNDPTAYKCNFEMRMLCEGMVEMGMDTTWKFTKSRTPTGGTGPKRAASGTYYAYLEASGVKPFYKAGLKIAQDFQTGIRCLKFDYLMYGSGMQTAKLIVKLSDETHLFSGTLAEQRVWQKAVVTVNQVRGEKIIFEGVRGSNSRSDIAFDNIVYTAGSC